MSVPVTTTQLRNGFGVTALVLGIVGAVFSWIPVFGGILAILAIIFGALGYARARKGEASSGMPIAGLALGAVAFVIQVAIFAAVGSAASSMANSNGLTQEQRDDMKRAGDAFAAKLSVTPAPNMAELPPTAPVRSYQDRFLSGEDGTYEVGAEIQPGTYKADPSGTCYWARLSSPSESDIIDNHLGTGRTSVAIKASDAGFVSHDCGTWTKVK